MPKGEEYTGEDLVAMRDNLAKDKDLYIGVREACRFYFDPQWQNSYIWSNKVSEKITPQDSIGIQSARDLVSGLYSNTIDFSSEFFGYQLSSKDISEEIEVKKYLAKCSEIALNKLAASNFGKSTLECLRGYVVVNTGVQYSEFDNSDKKIRFNTFMIDHCSIAENKNYIIDTVFREFEMTAAQAFEKWGDKIPDEVMDQFEDVNRRFEPSKYYHCVFPNADFEDKRQLRLEENRALIESDQPPRNILRDDEQRFVSYYVYEPDKSIIDQGAYKSMPYAVPRYDRTGETPYGRGNSFTARGIMSQLETLCYSISDGIELGVNPPIVKPPNSSDQFVDDITPGGTIYSGADGVIPGFYNSNINVQDAAAYKMQLEKEVKDLFYVDLFKMLESLGNQKMTATEVAARKGEQILLLLPIISNIYDELFSVQLKRTFHLLNDNGFFPKMPESLAEVWSEEQLKIDYTTKLDLKLKQLEIGQITKSIQDILFIAEAVVNAPDIAAVLKVDKINKELLLMNGVSPDYIMSDDETAAYHAAKKAQAEAEATAAAIAAGVKPIDTQLPIDPESIMGQQNARIGTSTGVY